ncbi:uncharacterized protein PFB0765w-like [Manduca sexta]|uniref:uncharacterized protein PFB0765w-like n=1 Tax=Manduca sexta TaxID=7130 RepID=UPI00188F0C24|nr:uncharacterized protein PFB0765w-like [Manduca sexta]
MSFITKRERVFNEYDLFDLPARNEGKLKAYSSCTDARAWSHFCSDKTEHLVEIIKRNNDTCRPKYIPTNVIVDTLMVTKNTEIARLKRKIEEFEQMLAAYDQLELSCDQKCEIANAHAAIRAANKELDDLCLDLDLSGFTEGIDSEAFETGKSRGDEPSKYRIDEWLDEREHHMKKMETKSNQMGMSSPRDASTSARDPRIEEMKDTIIVKDAKLNAMQNTIAVMENDVCEPYCIYAHIYTALEKIFGTLCQNDKYKEYLNLLTAGRDTRSIDIKGKILFKLKVLEKFSLALIAPCSQDFAPADCSCYRAELVTHVETTFALTSAETRIPSMDNKRAQLVADIMENDEMREILNKESGPLKDDIQLDVDFCTDSYTIDGENLKRLKNLQINYDDLMTCYEALKHEKNCLQVKCHKYEGLEKELENLRCQLREYNSLWNEKEHHRKRSTDLDTLKEKYLVLSDEASNLETQLKAETEINKLKSKAIDELRNDNIFVSLFHPDSKDIGLIDQNEAFKEQIKNLKDALFCNEEEKQNLQEEFQDKLKIINDLRMEIEDWKSTYEKVLQRNNYLENYTETFKDEAQRLMEENRNLTQDIEEKNTAIANLMNVINNKSQNINNLLEEIEHRDSDNNNLQKELQDLRAKCKSSTDILVREKMETMSSLQLARQESQELLKKIKDYDDVIHKNDDISKALEAQVEDYNKLKEMLLNTIEENKNLQINLASRENNNSILLKEIQRLREKKQMLQNELVGKSYQLGNAIHSMELTKKESEELMERIHDTEKLKEDLLKANVNNQNLVQEMQILRNDISKKDKEIEMLQENLNYLKKQNDNLIKVSENEVVLEKQLTELKKAYKLEQLKKEHTALQKEKEELQKS